jgi:hypothetical protein
MPPTKADNAAERLERALRFLNRARQPGDPLILPASHTAGQPLSPALYSETSALTIPKNRRIARARAKDLSI